MHRKRMHGELHQLLYFRCHQCNERFPSENTKVTHEKVSGGQRTEATNRRRCWKCGKELSKANLARQASAWTANEVEGGMTGNVRPEESLTRAYRPIEKACPNCGRTISATKRGGEA